MTSDSESEIDINSRKNFKPFKWTPEYEDQLETLLMKNFFDFNATAKEFNRIINGDGEPRFHIDAKQIQLRWTDVEIRKYRLHQDSACNERGQAFDPKELTEEDDQLPPLEQVDQAHNVQLNTFKYEGPGSSEEEDNGGRVTYYTNLEELD